MYITDLFALPENIDFEMLVSHGHRVWFSSLRFYSLIQAQVHTVYQIHWHNDYQIHLSKFLIISISFVKNSFCSLILFLCSLNCPSEFSCGSLNVFVTDILDSWSVRLQYSMPLCSAAGKLSFSFYDGLFPWFFVSFRCIANWFGYTYVYIYILLKFFSIIGCYKILNIVQYTVCAIQ